MNPFGMLESLSISGGDAAPSNATGGTAYISMNSPFTVLGRDSKASTSGGLDWPLIIALAAAAGVIGWALK